MERMIRESRFAPKGWTPGRTLCCPNPAHGDAVPSCLAKTDRGGLRCLGCGLDVGLLAAGVLLGCGVDEAAVAKRLEEEFGHADVQAPHAGNGRPKEEDLPPAHWQREQERRGAAFRNMPVAEASRLCAERRLDYAGAVALDAGLGSRRSGEGDHVTVGFVVEGVKDGTLVPWGWWERDGAPGKAGRGKSVKDGHAGVIALSAAIRRYDERVRAGLPAVLGMFEGESDTCAAVGAILADDDSSPICAFGVTGVTVAPKLEAYASAIGGRRIGLFLDDDDEARGPAEAAARDLAGRVGEVRDVRLPFTDKERALVADGRRVAKDVRWLLGPDGGRSVGDLLAAYDAAPPVDARALDADQPGDDEHDEEEDEAERRPWPPAPSDVALIDLPGEFVRLVAPTSESDPAGLLLQYLAAAGNVMGRSARYFVESTPHFANEYLCVVGETSHARKGTGLGRVIDPFRAADPEWEDRCIVHGLSSGEGLIGAARDPEPGSDRVGILDKRLFAMESEFASVLRRAARDGNTISAVLRQAWESGNLRVLTRNDPLRATGVHLSLLAHVTEEELRKTLSSTDISNGLANRIMFCCVRRAQELPFGGSVDPYAMQEHIARLRRALAFAKTLDAVQMAPATRPMWAAVYGPLGVAPAGAASSVLARAEPHVIRLALVYAALGRARAIQPEHLLAALEAWRYCRDSAIRIFGASSGSSLADDLHRELKLSPEGLPLGELHDVVGRNYRAAEIRNALDALRRAGCARRAKEAARGGKGGRPSQRWFAVKGARAVGPDLVAIARAAMPKDYQPHAGDESQESQSAGTCEDCGAATTSHGFRCDQCIYGGAS